LHQIVIRGIERKAIFGDDTDLKDFVERLSEARRNLNAHVR
jgi:hypothetical protein